MSRPSDSDPTWAQIEPFVEGARVVVRAPHPQRNHPREAVVLDPPRQPGWSEANGALVRYEDGEHPGEERVPASALTLASEEPADSSLDVTPGEATVIGVRLDALKDAIAMRDWGDVEFQYDRVRSSIERAMGTRNREVDRLRAGGDTRS